jgi:hypothetical protein
MSNRSFETLTETELLEIIPMTFIALENANEVGTIRDILILTNGLDRLLDRLIELLLTTDQNGNPL